MPAWLVWFISQCVDRSVQHLVLIALKRLFDECSVFVSQSAIEARHKFIEYGLSLGLKFLRQPQDDWPVLPARPVLDEFARFLFDDCLGWSDVLETVLQGRFADPFE